MNILFTGIGGPTPLGLARSVKMAQPNTRCVGADASPWAPSHFQSDLFDKTFRIPNADDPSYWSAVDQLVEREKIDFAFIVPETEVLVWARRAAHHRLPCAVHLPHLEIASFCFNKLSVAQLLYPLGLAPQTIPMSSAELTSKKDFPLQYPYWVRVQSGAGALGALKIESSKDLDTWMALHGNRTDFISSEFLPGRNYACKLLYNEGSLIQSGSAERIDYLLAAAAPSGISGMCSRGRLLNRPDLVERSVMALETISRHVGKPLHGMFTVDFKENLKGEPLITEINIRHVSFTYAFTLGGINFAATTVQLLKQSVAEKSIANTFNSEDFFVRGVDAPIRLVPYQEAKAFR